MLDRVPVNVIDVTAHVLVIANQMFPVATLPDAPFTADDASSGSPLIPGQSTREARLDVRPAIGVVGIIVREAPDAVQVVGQDHDGQHFERPRRLRRPERCPQLIRMLHQQTTAAFQKIDGEEVGAARHTGATIVRHAASVAAVMVPRYRHTARIGVRKSFTLVAPGSWPLRHRRAQGPPYKNAAPAWVDTGGRMADSSPSCELHATKLFRKIFGQGRIVPRDKILWYPPSTKMLCQSILKIHHRL